ncbi:HDOD domain-containing protein [Nitrincola tapanii]|uniref:HDOD domain-containing protein n=1 Tax=Nitrincola tapanii TaxID=1708751 RepID=A0A5A9W475_9GAMM|nr:HDOD domain-containing protein [Nitrincola tapanii]KAA0875284.1 HDOD domain-containing protein [Nitrincola tapanii]
MHKAASQLLTLEFIQEQLEQLPLLPGVVFELMKSDPEGETFYEDMIRLAKKDPPLASLILGHANSAAYIGKGAVDSIETALARVGSHTILQILMAISVARVFLPSKEEQRNIWRHSLEVAQISSFMARRSCFPHVKPETAYMAGLLHDIGRFVMLQIAPEALKKTEVRGWGGSEELIEVEQKSLGFTHTIVGQMACKKMHLPKLISNIVRYHHQHEVVRHPKVPKDLADLLLIIQFSDALSFYLATESGWSKMSSRELHQKIQEEVISSHWDESFLPLSELVDALPRIFQDCESACEVLGIRK